MAAMLLAAGSTVAVPTSMVNAAPATARLGIAVADGECQVGLPGGTQVLVADRGGTESTELLHSNLPSGGIVSFSAQGHDYVIPASLVATPDAIRLSDYDTTALAQHACGLSDTATPGSSTTSSATTDPATVSGRYRLGRLRLHTISPSGAVTSGFVLLTNMDDNRLARPTVVTDGGTGSITISVPTGHYAAAYLSTKGSQFNFIVDPNITVTDSGTPTQATLDARDATLQVLVPTTPTPSVLESKAYNLWLGNGDGPGEGFGLAATFLPLDPINSKIAVNPTAVRPAHGHYTGIPSFTFASPDGTTKPYLYHIAEPEDSPTSFPTAVDPNQLAEVDRSYGAPGASTMESADSSGEPSWAADTGIVQLAEILTIDTGQQLTEFYNTGPDLTWTTITDDTVTGVNVEAPTVSYRAGQHLTENFNTGALHPNTATNPTNTFVLCNACGSTNEIQLNLQPTGDNTPGHVAFFDGNPADAAQVSVYRNGEFLGSGDPDDQLFAPVSPGSANYEFDESYTSSGQPLSTAGVTTWTFTANPGHGSAIQQHEFCADLSQNCTTLPLLFLDYDTDSNLLNQLSVGTHTLDVHVQRQVGAARTPVDGAAVAVSYDGGTTWQALHTTGFGVDFQARFTVPATAAGQTVSLRVSAWDGSRSRIDQTVTNAYQVH